MYSRILVALDGSAAAEQVLPHVEALAEKFGSTVILLRATMSVAEVVAQTSLGDTTTTNVGMVDPTPIVEAEERAANEYLRDIAARLSARGLRVQPEEHNGPPGNVILEQAAALKADLIAMTTHGRTGLGRVVFGSTAEHVLRHATCPILLQRITDVD